MCRTIDPPTVLGRTLVSTRDGPTKGIAMLTHRQIARNRTRTWQACAVALLGVAGAAAMLPIQRLLTPGEASVLDVPPVPTGTTPGMELAMSGVDSADLSRILAGIGEPPLPVAPPEPAPPAPDSAAPPPPPAPPATLAYIGSIITPRTRHAVLRLSDSRRLVRQGDELDGSRVVLVEPDQVTLERDGVKTTLALEQRTKAWPDEPPKRPVAFKTAPGLPVGSQTVRPIGGAGLPQTFDQAREQARARALAEAAKRAAVNPPPPSDAVMQSGRDAVMAMKMLSDPNLEVNDSTMDQLEALGVIPGMSLEEAVGALKGAGVEAGDRVMGLLKQNAEKSDATTEVYRNLDPETRSIYDRLPPVARTEFLRRRASGEFGSDSEAHQFMKERAGGS